MAQYVITWIDKPGGSNNPNTRIQRVGGPDWDKSADAVILEISLNTNSYYVKQGGWVQVEVGTRNGVKYLRTKSDGTPLDNLLSLTNVAKA